MGMERGKAILLLYINREKEEKMNIIQRIILILGAIMLAIIIGLTVPQLKDFSGSGDFSNFLDVWVTLQCKIVCMWTVGIIGTTILLFFAFKDIKKK